MSPLSSSAVKPHDVFGVADQYVTPSKTLDTNNQFAHPYNQMLNFVTAIDCSPVQVSCVVFLEKNLEIDKTVQYELLTLDQ